MRERERERMRGGERENEREREGEGERERRTILRKHQYTHAHTHKQAHKHTHKHTHIDTHFNPEPTSYTSTNEPLQQHTPTTHARTTHTHTHTHTHTYKRTHYLSLAHTHTNIHKYTYTTCAALRCCSGSTLCRHICCQPLHQSLQPSACLGEFVAQGLQGINIHKYQVINIQIHKRVSG